MAGAFNFEMAEKIYKILDAAAWADAKRAGVFAGAPVDLKDGYIHFSTAAQLRETAARHFAGVTNLVLVAFDAEALGPQLKWEPSRGGALFPHLYAPLDPARAVAEDALPLDPDGAHQFPASLP
ncbi:hypothetical protein sos41_38200 [Alphaproteobacteria bacterium SO-S41]|nr:hypothetical protein sos41_38200 [Alphaproteobacteria bacterium SO-S41]